MTGGGAGLRPSSLASSQPQPAHDGQPAKPRATVAILNYNGRRFLEACLEAVLAQELEGGFEVLLLDNGSEDDSLGYVRERFPEVRAVALGRNRGYSGANNVGFAEAASEYVVLLNNDTRVRPGWLAALVRTADSDPRIGAVTSKLVFLDRPETIQNAGSLMLTDGSGADRGFGERDRGQYELREEVFAACGCAVLLARRMLDDVGGFDETFFAYYEDTDLSWRMRLRGWQIVYEPTAVVEHVHTGTNVEWSPFFIFHVDRNRLFMILKNAPAGFVLGVFLGFAWRSARLGMRAFLPRQTAAAGDRATPRFSRARIELRVLRSLLEHLPEMLGKRRQIRRRRTVSDAQIRGWMYPRELWDAR